MISELLIGGAVLSAAAGMAWLINRAELRPISQELQPPPARRRTQRLNIPLNEQVRMNRLLLDGLEYRAVAQVMADAGYPISKSSVCRHAHRIGVRRRPQPKPQTQESTS